MPRIRTIKPQFWLDERLGSVPRDARLLYIGLWNLSDDHGVFEWRPARIRIQLFPYDEDITTKDIDSWLTNLVKTKDVYQFQTEAGQFGYIPTFLHHQEIKNPSKWHFAEIPEELTKTIQADSNTTPVLPEEGVSTILALPVGNRGVGSREKSIGNRESNTNGAVAKKPYGQFGNVMLTDGEYAKLQERFNGNLSDKIETLSEGMATKPKKYKYDSHYAAILSWARRDERNGGNDGHKPAGINQRLTQSGDTLTEDELKRKWGVGMPLV